MSDPSKLIYQNTSNRNLYLELMKKSLLDVIYTSPDTMVKEGITVQEAREEGKDWPERAHTMIGMKRLNNLQACIEDVLRRNIPGDIIETGVWRGGATIFARAVLKAYGVTDRRVWVADSFEGLPPPSPKEFPADEGLNLFQHKILAVSLEEVQANFASYNLLDDQVHFLKGFFKDTLPIAPIDKLAVLRLDGDLYESTIQALGALYPKLSPGGYVIIDDYGAIPACKQAVQDYREQNGITAPIYKVDWTGIYWRKGDTITIDNGPIELNSGDVGEADLYSKTSFQQLSRLWTKVAWERRIFKELTWMGFPVLQLSEDLMMMQELIWKVKPDIIIETGSHKGGAAAYYASLCKLIGKGKVITIDINPKYDKKLLKKQFGNRIHFIQGSSTDSEIIQKLVALIQPYHSVLVALDSDHSKSHVLRELEIYSKFVTPGSYIVVFDGSMEYIHETPKSRNRDWKNDNPAVAARNFLKDNPEFTHDAHYTRLGITYCLDGFLRRQSVQAAKSERNKFLKNARQFYHHHIPLSYRIKIRDIREKLFRFIRFF